jgi:exodeoxyribonuclease VII large subunit
VGEALEPHRLEGEGKVAAGPDLPGPFAVGRYARKLQEEMRRRARVLLVGEVTGVGRSKVQAYFELRDGEGAVPCAIWLDDLEKAGLPEGALRDGAEVVIAGGPDYYPGGGHASPSFSFRATHVRLAGEGDLLARLEALRKQLRAEGVFELQKQLARPLLPKTIGVVTAESGAARRDLLAGLERRGWGGTVVWAFAPVQDRHAAPAIAGAIQDLAAQPQVEAIAVTRGGGSLADLWAFCDETLCRTVAMLRVPVISAVGHERDSTLIDDVAAVACSTPTHAAEAVVPLDCGAARIELRRSLAALRRAAEGSVRSRTPHLVALARGPARALRRERLALNQKTREIRAASERGVADRVGFQQRVAGVVLERAARRAAGAEMERRRTALHRAEVALRAHEPEHTLARGYALVEDEEGEPLTGRAAAAAAERVKLRFADGTVNAVVKGEPSAADADMSEQDSR